MPELVALYNTASLISPLCSIFSDFAVSIQQIQCALQLSFEVSTLLYIAAPIAAFLLVPVLRVALGILSYLKLYGVKLSGDALWSRAFYFASVVLFFIIAPTVGALAKTQQWCVVYSRGHSHRTLMPRRLAVRQSKRVFIGSPIRG